MYGIFTEEVFIDSVQDDCQIDFVMPNDTNQDVLKYFARVTNHYLHLARSSTISNLPESPRHTRKYPIIADSGAHWHMFKEKEFFTSLNPSQGHVVLGDGKTSLSIHGIGTVTCRIGQHILTIEDVRYVPGLSESIYSLFRHIQEPQHSLQSSFEDGLSLIFPEFTTKAVLGHHDIYLDAEPVIDPDNFSSVDVSTDQFCRNLKEFTNDVTKETKYLDNLLKNLRQYYKEVKTKRQLNLDVPAGLRRATTQQRQLRDFQNSQLEYPSVECDSALPSEPSLLSQVSDTLPNPSCHDLVQPTLDTTTTNTNSSSSVPIPILRCVDKVSSSLPSQFMLTKDLIRAGVGYRKIETIKKHLSDLYQPTITLDSQPPDAVLDAGDFSTLLKVPKNTKRVPRPASFLDVVHMDIVFGPEVSLGNVHYGLLFTDRYSRMTYIYPLQNLTIDIVKQLEAFFAHLGTTSKHLISNFDTKLIGGKAREYLNTLKIHVNVAPANRQDKNGLVE